MKEIKITRTNYFILSEYHRVLSYSADTEYRMDIRYSPN